MKILDKDSYILAAITSSLYLQSFLRLLAQSNYYEIPINLMSLDILKITASSFFYIFLFIIFIIAYFFALGFKRNKNPNFLRVAFVFAFLGLPVSVFYVTKGLSYLLAVVLCLIWLVYVIYSYRKNKEHYVGIFTGKSWHYDSDLSESLRLVYNRNKYWISVVFVIVFFFNPYFGTYVNSRDKMDYDVFYKDGYFAIVSYSADNFIAKKIENHQLANGYYLFKIDSIEGKRIIRKDIRLIP